jgi:uncharacterized membrane protein
VLKDSMPFLLTAAMVMIGTYFVTLPITTLWLLLLCRIAMASILYLGIMRLLNVAILNECVEMIKSKMVKK